MFDKIMNLFGYKRAYELFARPLGRIYYIHVGYYDTYEEAVDMQTKLEGKNFDLKNGQYFIDYVWRMTGK